MLIFWLKLFNDWPSGLSYNSNNLLRCKQKVFMVFKYLIAHLMLTVGAKSMIVNIPYVSNTILFLVSFFFLTLDFCQFCVVILFFIPATMTSNFEGFLCQILTITLFSYLNSWERDSIFPFQCWVLNKGTAGTIFITSLVWRGPWLGIEPGSSRTQSQHSTTRLSRRRFLSIIDLSNFKK